MHLPRSTDPIVNCQFPAAFGKKTKAVRFNEFSDADASEWLANHVHKFLNVFAISGSTRCSVVRSIFIGVYNCKLPVSIFFQKQNDVST